MKTSLLGGALVVSLAANIYLFATRPSGNQSAPTGSAADATAETSNRGKARIELHPHARPALDEPGAQPNAGDAAADRAAALEAELAKARAEADRNRPLNERFANDTERSPEVEDQIRKTLDQVFPAPPGGKPGYAVECHGTICKLTVDSDVETNWMADLQGEHSAPFGAMMFSASGPSFLETYSAKDAAGLRYVQSIFTAITGSPVVADCKQRFTDPGFVILQIVLNADRQVHVAMTGKLADKPFGSCLRPVIEQAPSQVPPLPATIQSLPDSSIQIRPAQPDPTGAPTPRRSTPERVSKLADLTATMPQ